MTHFRTQTTLSETDVTALVQSGSRLDAVHKAGVLDRPADEQFDAVTELAARLVKVPASFISIVDVDRDFYPSQTGFPAQLSNDRQMTGRTFCHYVLENAAPLAIHDTLSDPVWANVPTVQSLGVRAYLGVPMTLDGEIVGSLCAIDMQPRTWSEDDVATMRELANSAAREIRLRAEIISSRQEAQIAVSAGRGLEEFVNSTSQAMRTPLQVLEMNNRVLDSLVAEEHKSVTRAMHTAVDSLKFSLAGLATSSDIALTATLNKRQVTGMELLFDARGITEKAGEAAGVSLEVGVVAEATLFVDYGQMLRSLVTLVTHCMRASARGSVVMLSCNRISNFAELVISDKGAGMSQADALGLFDAASADDLASSSLAIVKQLVDLNGGTIRVTTALERGTSFILAFPCK